MAQPTQHSKWIGGAALRMTVAPMAVVILLIIVSSHVLEAQTFTTLHGFSGMPDGSMPIGGLTMSASGDLYGTTEYGGAEGWGMVFKLVHTGGTWIMHPLYSFPSIHHQGADDGAAPTAGVTIGPNGNLYGTTRAAAAPPTMARCSNCRRRRRCAKALFVPGERPFFTASPEAVTGECRQARLCLTAPAICMALQPTAV